MRLDLAHIAGSTFNTPLLMHRRRLDTALNALGPRIIDGTILRPGPDVDKLRTERPERHALAGSARRRYAGGGYLADHGIGVFPIIGTLMRRGSWLDAECGLMSYGLIRQGYDDMLADPSVRGVIAEYDTPGGEAGGCFDLARHMRAAAEAAGKPLWAHANELAASAGYALASAASRIWVSTTAEVGSIGVVAAHVDVSAADAKAGLKWTYIFEGDRKVDGNPHEPLSSEAEAAIRADVSSLYEMFVDIVAQHRAFEPEAVRATEAETFRGSFAVDSGLADEVGTLDEAMIAFAADIDELATASGPRAVSQTKRRMMDPKAKTGAQPAATTEPAAPDVPAPAPAVEPVAPAPAAPPADAAAQAVAAERVRCAGLYSLAAQAAKLGVTFDASKAVTDGVSVVAARETVLNAAADRDAAETVTTTTAAAQPGGGMTSEAKASAWSKALKRK